MRFIVKFHTRIQFATTVFNSPFILSSFAPSPSVHILLEYLLVDARSCQATLAHLCLVTDLLCDDLLTLCLPPYCPLSAADLVPLYEEVDKIPVIHRAPLVFCQHLPIARICYSMLLILIVKSSPCVILTLGLHFQSKCNWVFRLCVEGLFGYKTFEVQLSY